jgi:hypothetical protein
MKRPLAMHMQWSHPIPPPHTCDHTAADDTFYNSTVSVMPFASTAVISSNEGRLKIVPVDHRCVPAGAPAAPALHSFFGDCKLRKDLGGVSDWKCDGFVGMIVSLSRDVGGRAGSGTLLLLKASPPLLLPASTPRSANNTSILATDSCYELVRRVDRIVLVSGRTAVCYYEQFVLLSLYCASTYCSLLNIHSKRNGTNRNRMDKRIHDEFFCNHY